MGGGHKQMYRIIDFKRDKEDIPGMVKTIEYDPRQNCPDCPGHVIKMVKSGISLPLMDLKVGQTVVSGKGSSA